MRIAITSQNRRNVTDHAGRCRNFWIYDIDGERVAAKTLLSLDPTQTLHESGHQIDPRLAEIQTLLTAGMSANLQRRLQAYGIHAELTELEDPDAAVAAYMAARTSHSPGSDPSVGRSAQAGAACCSHGHAHDHDEHHGEHGASRACCGHGQGHGHGRCQHHHGTRE